MSLLKPRVLIIDYEPRGIKQLHDPLENAGYEVLVAKDGLAGIEVFKNEKPDLALIEAMLPKRHGFEVCQELKQTDHGRKTPVVIVTSVYKGRKYRSQAIHHHGCDEYLEKPISPDMLLGTVERLLGRRSAAPPPVVETVPATEPVVETVPAAKPIAETVPAAKPIAETVPAAKPIAETVPATKPIAETVPATRSPPPESVAKSAPPPGTGTSVHTPSPRPVKVPNPLDPAESEIVERLNDIFGDNGG